MSFLNAILLGGLGAATIPVLIHWIYRKRIHVVNWGAMHLLEAALRRNRRRMRWEQLLILLVRCLLVAALALALARPILSSLPTLLGDTAAASVLLVDNSLSMLARGTGETAFDQAREFAVQRLNALPRGSEAVVHWMAGGPPPPPTTEPLLVARQVNEVSAAGRAEVPGSLAQAAGSLERLRNAYREVIVVSDFQRNNWSAPGAEDRNRALTPLRSLDPAARLTLVSVGAPFANNVSISPIEMSRDTLGVGQSAQVRATIRNHAAQAWTGLRVHFQVDGSERSATQVDLEPGGNRTVRFTHVFDSPGSHPVEIRVDADALAADNSSLHIVDVWDRLPVLLVNGEPSSSPLRGETDFLTIALAPFNAGKVASADLIETRTIAPNQINGGELAKARVCVLANVQKLNTAQVTMLKRFVSDGGGLLVFPGSKLDADWWNRTAQPAGLLPMPMRALQGTRHGGQAARVVMEPFTHPALTLFNDPSNGKLSEAEVQTWIEFLPIGGGTNPPVVLARLDSGAPFLVESRVGRGRVIAMATTCDPEWNNLPARPAFVPLMQTLVVHLASALNPPRNMLVGEPLIALLPGSDAGKSAVLALPSGQRRELTARDSDEHAIVEFAETFQPGVYRLQLPDGTTRDFSVRTPPEESELERLNEDELAALAETLGAEVAESWETYQSLDRDRRFGRELTHTLLLKVLGLALTELALQQWFARRIR